MTPKQQLIAMVDALPDDCTMEEALELLLQMVREHVAREKQAEAAPAPT